MKTSEITHKNLGSKNLWFLKMLIRTNITADICSFQITNGDLILINYNKFNKNCQKSNGDICFMIFFFHSYIK